MTDDAKELKDGLRELEESFLGSVEYIEESIIVDEEARISQSEEKLVPLLPVHIQTKAGDVILCDVVEHNSREYPKKLMESLQKFRENGWFLDAAITHGDDKIFGHRLVLMAASSFLENVFEDISSNNKPVGVDLSVMPKEALHKLIDFIYTGKIKFSSKQPEEFLLCAVLLQMDFVTEQYFKFLAKHASPSNFETVLSLLRKFLPNNKDLRQRILQNLQETG